MWDLLCCGVTFEKNTITFYLAMVDVSYVAPRIHAVLKFVFQETRYKVDSTFPTRIR